MIPERPASGPFLHLYLLHPESPAPEKQTQSEGERSVKNVLVELWARFVKQSHKGCV